MLIAPHRSSDARYSKGVKIPASVSSNGQAIVSAEEQQDVPQSERISDSSDRDATFLVCSVCRSPLASQPQSVVCANGHSFDRAREGYFNLLRGKPAGDSKEMLLARRRFLQAGRYRPISDAVNAMVAGHLARRESNGECGAAAVILDVGCGEGYYLRQLASAWRADGALPLQLVGVDTSRDAIRLAARSGPALCFVVADVHELIPLASGSVEVLINIFSPRNAGEFARVIAPGGMLLIVIPQPGHLRLLRSLAPLLGIQEGKAERLLAEYGDSFEHLSTAPVEYDLVLNGDQVIDLITMSPTFRHIDPESLDALRDLAEAPADVRVNVLAFRRR
ncbi:MAG: methyltransferase domain-containing protein [Chloroflexota bacterium]|nr:methyltransferase domain-containing protein [Chloroflexota bacterium]